MSNPESSVPEKPSKVSLADSTQSGASNYEPYEQPRKSSRSTYTFGAQRKSRQSIGAYTSLFARKLLPPLGFYRESDKYAQLRAKFKDDPYKLDALDEMWDDYQKYQVRKRFRWPPQIFCKRFFWTTGYYADYQRKHRATKLRQPGEDSSEDEFIDPAGQYFTAGEDDINVEEFERYREAKKQANPDPRKHARFNLDGSAASDGSKHSDDHDHEHHHHNKEVEEVETIVEYTLIRDPHHKKRRKSSVAGSNRSKKRSVEEKPFNMQDLEAGANKKLVTRRKSVATTDPTTGEKVTDVQESTEIKQKEGSTKSKGKPKPKK